MDVKSLYPNIPRKEGLKACETSLKQRTNKTIQTKALMTMMETVLENNIFNFGELKYKQIDGTAIGSRLGRNFACTYMGEWESTLLQKSTTKPLLFIRYIDDIFGIWTESIQKLKEFHKTANDIHPNIQVDLKSSTSSLEFLDVLIEVKDSEIQTSLYKKPTDNHLYLHAKSDHPRTTKKAIPYGLGIRAKRICSDHNQYWKERQEIKKHLKTRGYRSEDVETSLKKVDTIDRRQLLEYKTKKTTCKRVPLTLTYHRNLPNIQQIVHDKLNILHRSERMQSVFPQAPITAFRRDTNIGDILVHAKHKSIFERNNITKCQKCAICTYISDEHEHIFKGRQYTFNRINCKTSNLVYAIKCRQCEEVMYVGETGTTIYERFQNHISCIKRVITNPITDHFTGRDHSVGDLEIICLELIRSNDIHLRKIRESFWITKLQTKHPKGLNQNMGIGDGIRGSRT